LGGNVAGNPEMRLFLPVIWRIPRKFPAFRNGLCLRQANIAKHVCVECRKLAALMGKCQKLADPHGQSHALWLARGPDVCVVYCEGHIIPFRDV